jgi:uncharacterized protein (TIGR02300 family)
MPKDDWGTKRACPKCTIRFYDLNNDPMTCPSCESTFDLETILEVYKKPPRESAVQKQPELTEKNSALDGNELDEDSIILDDDDSAIQLEDELLENDDDSVSLEDLADVPEEKDEN